MKKYIYLFQEIRGGIKYLLKFSTYFYWKKSFSYARCIKIDDPRDKLTHTILKITLFKR